MLNHHFVEIKAPQGAIFREVLLWGESKWWPESSPMKYSRTDSEEVNVGTRFHQKVHKPFAPEWDVEVVSITPGREVSRKFLTGMFTGTDRVYVIPGRGSNEVHFLMDYEVSGRINRLLWNMMYLRKHDENIKLILRAMKIYLEGADAPAEEEKLSPKEEDRRQFFKSFIRRH